MKYTYPSQIIKDLLLLFVFCALSMLIAVALESYVLLYTCRYFGVFCLVMILFKTWGYLSDGVTVFQIHDISRRERAEHLVSWRKLTTHLKPVWDQFQGELNNRGQQTPRDEILSREALLNGDWRDALNLSMKKVKPDLADLHPESYLHFAYTRYAHPCYGYFSVLAQSLFVATQSRLRRWLVHRKFVFAQSDWVLDDLKTRSVEETADIHLPTLECCYCAMFCYMESMFKCIKISSSRRLSPSERSYWVGQFCLEKLVTHLNSKNEYQVNSDNVVATAQAVYYKFLSITGKVFPIIDIVNTIDSSVMDEFFELESVDDVLGPELNFLHFPFPFAGSLAIDNTSMV